MSENPIQNRAKDPRKVRLLKDEHIMELFGISKSCLYRWRINGFIPFKKIGHTNFYVEHVILKMLYLGAGKLPKELDEEDNLDDWNDLII